METVSIQIPAELYTTIYSKHGASTSKAIEECLQSLLIESEPEPKTTDFDLFMRPGEGTITGRVWEIADEIYEETGKISREAVVTKCMEEGINMNTASTQYSHWMNSVLESRRKR